ACPYSVVGRFFKPAGRFEKPAHGINGGEPAKLFYVRNFPRLQSEARPDSARKLQDRALRSLVSRRIRKLLAAQGVRPALWTRTRFQRLLFVLGKRRSNGPRLAAARTANLATPHRTPSLSEIGGDRQDCKRVLTHFATNNFDSLSGFHGDDLNGDQRQ